MSRSDRDRIVALDGAFHGETLGCTAVSGVEVFRRPFAGPLAQVFHVPSPGDPHVPLERAIESLAELLAKDSDHIAAVVVEPIVQGAAGYLAQVGWRVFEEARRRGAYLRPLGNVVYITPPLVIPDDDLDELLQIVTDSVHAVASH